ncbi:protein LTO1 homolog isoform X2 [Hemibagrus wyckioides]|uniref:protein LTO1 homolog isoform X2 n=1 Tax=Hemibagrus wyckioides TaxID=337641 RepID=UPI00266B5628|nr:protein LTO1 homolog isoform X2 [Hemibagrus wyckioides]
MAGFSHNITDDLFDAIIMADDRFHIGGYREGFEEGSQQGLIEGRNHGLLHGAKLSAEVSFYHGFALTWKCLLRNTEDVKTRKRLKAVESLDAMIQKFPYDDPQYESLQEHMESVRAKFRQETCSSAKKSHHLLYGIYKDTAY